MSSAQLIAYNYGATCFTFLALYHFPVCLSRVAIGCDDVVGLHLPAALAGGDMISLGLCNDCGRIISFCGQVWAVNEVFGGRSVISMVNLSEFLVSMAGWLCDATFISVWISEA